MGETEKLCFFVI